MLTLLCPWCGKALRDRLAKYKLRPRQRKAAEYVLEGMTNKQIAKEMHTSVQTVKNYLSQVYQVTGVSNRMEFALSMIFGERK